MAVAATEYGVGFEILVVAGATHAPRTMFAHPVWTIGIPPFNLSQMFILWIFGHCLFSLVAPWHKVIFYLIHSFLHDIYQYLILII